MKKDIRKIIKNAQDLAGNNPMLVNTIIKEILHYDILQSLSRSDVNRNIIFQGGTAIRLCYGGNRYSEDLDFVCPDKMNTKSLDTFKEIFIDTMSKTYGLEAQVKSPADKESDGVEVKRWKAKVLIENPTQGAKSSHKIHIEIANIPSYDPTVQMIHRNYDNLPSSRTDILLRVESLKEILADKAVAIGARCHGDNPIIKYRDVWDIKWLRDKGIPLDMEMVEKKIDDYNIKNFSSKLKLRMGVLNAEESSGNFLSEMSRFLDANMAENLKSFPGFSASIINSANSFMEEIENNLSAKHQLAQNPETVMSPAEKLAELDSQLSSNDEVDQKQKKSGIDNKKKTTDTFEI